MSLEGRNEKAPAVWYSAYNSQQVFIKLLSFGMT